MMRRLYAEDPLAQLSPVATSEDVGRRQREAHQVRMDASVEAYLLAVVRNTQVEPAVRLGASPRATLALARAARAYAYVVGRSYVLPDDIKTLAAPVLGHRLLLAADAEVMGTSGRKSVARVLESTSTPTEQ